MGEKRHGYAKNEYHKAMKKEFLSPEHIRDNALLLAKKIHTTGFVPTIMYVSLRGGATFGNAISEYFKLASHGRHKPLYAAVVAHSYGTFDSGAVHIDGWTFPPSAIRASDSVMLIDDIFDSGKTINVLAREILAHGVPRENLKIIVHDYKIRSFEKTEHAFVPDYYSRKINIKKREDDAWIHYLSHELDGLSDDEIREHYPQGVQETIISLINSKNEQR